MPGINSIYESVYCIVCHRQWLKCNCENQIKKFGIKAVKEYDKEIKKGNKYWGYQLYYNQIKGLNEL